MDRIGWLPTLFDQNSSLEIVKGTIHLRRWQIFMIFYPYPPPVGSFLLLSVSKIGKFLTPPPLKNADILNGWSQNEIKVVSNFKRLLLGCTNQSERCIC